MISAKNKKKERKPRSLQKRQDDREFSSPTKMKVLTPKEYTRFALHMEALKKNEKKPMFIGRKEGSITEMTFLPPRDNAPYTFEQFYEQSLLRLKAGRFGSEEIESFLGYVETYEELEPALSKGYKLSDYGVPDLQLFAGSCIEYDCRIQSCVIPQGRFVTFIDPPAFVYEQTITLEEVPVFIPTPIVVVDAPYTHDHEHTFINASTIDFISEEAEHTVETIDELCPLDISKQPTSLSPSISGYFNDNLVAFGSPVNTVSSSPPFRVSFDEMIGRDFSPSNDPLPVNMPKKRINNIPDFFDAYRSGQHLMSAVEHFVPARYGSNWFLPNMKPPVNNCLPSTCGFGPPLGERSACHDGDPNGCYDGDPNDLDSDPPQSGSHALSTSTDAKKVSKKFSP